MTWLISVHDSEDNTVATGEAADANGAIESIGKIERYLIKLKAETEAQLPENQEEELMGEEN